MSIFVQSLGYTSHRQHAAHIFVQKSEKLKSAIQIFDWTLVRCLYGLILRFRKALQPGASLLAEGDRPALVWHATFARTPGSVAANRLFERIRFQFQKTIMGAATQAQGVPLSFIAFMLIVVRLAPDVSWIALLLGLASLAV
jgi:hypothetical protein